MSRLVGGGSRALEPCVCPLPQDAEPPRHLLGRTEQGPRDPPQEIVALGGVREVPCRATNVVRHQNSDHSLPGDLGPPLSYLARGTIPYPRLALGLEAADNVAFEAFQNTRARRRCEGARHRELNEVRAANGHRHEVRHPPYCSYGGRLACHPGSIARSRDAVVRVRLAWGPAKPDAELGWRGTRLHLGGEGANRLRWRLHARSYRLCGWCGRGPRLGDRQLRPREPCCAVHPPVKPRDRRTRWTGALRSRVPRWSNQLNLAPRGLGLSLRKSAEVTAEGSLNLALRCEFPT
jgi:hypothetical protein